MIDEKYREYHRQRALKDYYENKEKYSIRFRRYYLKNKEKIKSERKKYYAKNKEKILKCNKKYNDKNREKRKIKRSEFYRKNKERINREKRKYYNENREKCLLSNKKWAKRNRNYMNEYRRNYYHKNIDKMRVHKKNYEIKYTKLHPEKIRKKRHRANLKRRASENKIIHAFAYDEWVAKKNVTNGICPKCNTFIGTEKLTLDHIFPVSKAEEGRIYTIDDVQPLCKSCNLIKNNKIEK